ncbi:catalase [Altererythrobacter aerius]|uniref:Catalase n=1 Tax=Tsuneonella aeria TaxID=1837929 RepID=A0A6I4TC69_9SPHN|nr:catalase [Tsuneonella aeria]MXO74247.1 catalase [Tsuneonella aeria]
MTNDDNAKSGAEDTGGRSFAFETGSGGETHQRVAKGGDHADEDAHLTTNQGVRISDNQNSLKSGARGPVLLEDFVLREKLFHFDHERIPERIVHARGSGAHGTFTCTRAVPELTRAAPLQAAGKETPVFARFSTVAGNRGSVDTPRDVRGFAVKFYTDEGNWDLVGNNCPVFFIQDAMKFPDLVHAVKMEADRGYPQATAAHDTFWDFVSLMPESTNMLLWAMSDRTIPRSLRMMEGFGVHTFRLVNAEGKSTFCKFHWKPVLGMQSTVWDEAAKLQGADNDYHRRDLYEAIDRGDFPAWDLGLQTFDEEFAAAQPYDVLDATKIIPEEDCPVQIVGRMELNRNPANFFAETEQVAFCPANVIPGIDFTADPLLHGRLFSYLDTQLKRLGTTNFHQIPINAPRCPMRNFQRDGHMQMMVPEGRANYEPNSLAMGGEDGGPRECPETGYTSFAPRDIGGEAGDSLRIRAELFADHFSQARQFYRSQTPSEQAHIVGAFVFELSKVELVHIRTRMVSRLRNVDEDLARRVAEGLALDLPPAAPAARPPIDMRPSDALSIQKNMRRTLEGRVVGVLFGENTEQDLLDELQDMIEDAGGSAHFVAPKVGLGADGQLAGSPSAKFDAIALALTEEDTAKLLKEGAAVQFVMDAFGHLKAIGASAGSLALLDKAGVEADDGVTGLDAAFIEAATRRFFDREPKVRMLV